MKTAVRGLFAVAMAACISAAQAQAPLAEGEVRRVDKEGARVTIKHGEIRNLDMPPMTMVFQVRDKALLDQVKPGDKVRFSAEKVEGKYTVTHIEPER